MRAALISPFLAGARRFWPTDRFLWPAARLAISNHPDRGKVALYKTADGFQMPLQLEAYPDGAMYYGVYELTTVRAIRRLLRPGDGAVDVGGNIGYLTLQMAEAVGQLGHVDTFEPMPVNQARLKKVLAMNNVRNVSLHEFGLADAAGSAQFYSLENSAAHALSSMRPLSEDNSTISCELARMDDVVNTPVRLIKIDVEGAEVGVLLGAQRILREHRPYIIVEQNAERLASFGHTFKDVVAAANKACSYKQSQLSGGGRGRRQEGNFLLSPS